MDERIKKLADAFCAWQLPDSVAADLCATEPNFPHARYGTHLLIHAQAAQLFEYLSSKDLI